MKISSYGCQNISKDDIEAVVKVLKSDYLTQGPKVEEFERKIANYVGTKYAVAVSSGTAALHIAYQVAGISQGDEIITTPNTFVATANAALYLGAKPVFSDIELETYNLDPEKIEEKITSRTKAIVPVHFAGHPCQMKEIWRIARKHKLKVIEDASHALGAVYQGKKIGNGQSDMTIFSFHPVKTITTGEGGLIVTNNKDNYQKLINLRHHGISKSKRGLPMMSQLGYNYRLSDLHAALGKSQLERINQLERQRKKVVKWYQEELSNIDEIILPTVKEGCASSWHLYVIRTRQEKERNKLRSYLENNHIGVNLHYPAVYSHPYYQKNDYNSPPLSFTEEYQNTAITLPLHTKLSRDDLDYFGKIMKNFFGKLRKWNRKVKY